MNKNLNRLYIDTKRAYRQVLTSYKKFKRATKRAQKDGFKTTSRAILATTSSFVRMQVKIRPRIKLFSKFLASLSVALIITSFIAGYIEANKAKVVVNGHQILVAQEKEAGPSAEPIIDQYIEAKKSPFEFRKPLEEGSLSQGFTSYHPAYDIAGPLGEDIHPVGGGTIVFTGLMADGHGNTVVVDHGDGLKSLYAHMNKIYVGVGDKIEAKTAIGSVGLTGRTTGPHVHLEIFNNDRQIDPGLVLPANQE